jgi:hypothetical protein
MLEITLVDHLTQAAVPLVHDFFETGEITKVVKIRVDAGPPELLMSSFD